MSCVTTATFSVYQACTSHSYSTWWTTPSIFGHISSSGMVWLQRAEQLHACNQTSKSAYKSRVRLPSCSSRPFGMVMWSRKRGLICDLENSATQDTSAGTHDDYILCPMQDGALDDEELNRFQVRCFNAPLQPPELQGVKEVVGDRIPGVSICINCIAGWLCRHQLQLCLQT